MNRCAQHVKQELILEQVFQAVLTAHICHGPKKTANLLSFVYASVDIGGLSAQIVSPVPMENFLVIQAIASMTVKIAELALHRCQVPMLIVVYCLCL